MRLGWDTLAVHARREGERERDRETERERRVDEGRSKKIAADAMVIALYSFSDFS